VQITLNQKVERFLHLTYGYENRRGLCGLLRADLTGEGDIIALAHTKVLRLVRSRLRALDDHRLRVGCANVISCRFAPATTIAGGMPCPSVSRLRFVPLFPQSMGSGPVL